MKLYLNFLVLLFSIGLYAQKDSLQLGDSYLEDQLYVGVTYNQLFNQPENVIGSGFSYGLSTGYIRDISLVKTGKLALGLGIGYAYDSFNHGYKISSLNNEAVIDVDASITETSKLNAHWLEFPVEFRWRTSTANKYKFWRIYTGIKISYNFKNTFEFTENGVLSSYKNIERFQKVQYGLTLSAGYSTFNFSLYYGLKPLLKTTTLGTNPIDTQVIKLGLMFYIL